MGIKGLSKVIAEHADGSVKEGELKAYFGRKVAIDASMSLYQFLIAVRSEGSVLTNESGEVTSHLVGIFSRSIRLAEQGIKPVWVFDGKPPEMKSFELTKRKEKRDEAEKELTEAKETGDAETVERFEKRLVKVTREHTAEAKKLLQLMGMPVLEAPCEAEAQCAAIVKAGLVYGVATEDMDALTFGAPVLLRNLTAAEKQKVPVKEYRLEKILDGLGMSHEEFIDLCILLGCDYCDSIRGIGPKRAIELMQQHHSIENVVKSIAADQKSKYVVPSEWQYDAARKLFTDHEVADASSLDFKWSAPDEDGLIEFLCKAKGFGEDRVKRGCEKLRKARAQKTQCRLDDFFKPLGTKSSDASTTAKRKALEKKEQEKSSKKPKKATAGKGGRKK